jgi:hypothetical protein
VYTFGECVTTGVKAINAGSESAANDQPQRDQAALFLRQLIGQVHTLAPWWWKHGDGQVAIALNVSKGSCPVDFGGFGTEGQVWLLDIRRLLIYLDAPVLDALRLTNPTQRGDPTHYTLRTQTVLGIRELDVWPTPGRNITLDLKTYWKKLPEFVDCPISPGVAVNAAVGLVNGPITYRVTFVHPAGETEGGFVSGSISPILQKVDVDPIPVSPARTVTARRLWRTAAGGYQHKLVPTGATLSDNLTTKVLLENTADAALGVNLPTPDLAVTGMELYPSDWHDSLFAEGLIKMLRAHVKQTPFELFSKVWKEQVRRLWADQRPDRHVVHAMPAYGSNSTPRRSWRRLSS